MTESTSPTPQDTPQASQSPTAAPKNPRRWPWGLVIPLLLQLGILAYIAVPPALVRTQGSTVYISTAPIDPYDLLRGRYVTLQYELESSDILESLPGWRSPQDFPNGPPAEVFILLEPRATDSTNPETNEQEQDLTTDYVVWEPVDVAYALPTELEDDQQVIRATLYPYNSFRAADIGMTQYFIPEAIGDQLETDMQANAADTVAEVRVDHQGNTALVGLWVEDRRY